MYMKHQLFKPFNNLEAVNNLIRLYQYENISLVELSSYYGCAVNQIRNTLIYYQIPILRNKTKIVVERPVGKYDHLIFETINMGKDYKKLLKEKHLKIYTGNLSLNTKKKIKEQP